MSILVTGGAGYIGSHMVHHLLDQGESVVVLDDLSTGFRSAVPDKAVFIEGDAGDPDTATEVIRTHGIRSIIHFAARLVVPESVADPLGYYLANTVKTRHLIAAAVAGRIEHLIFSSTAAVYGGASLEPVSETASTSPASPYGTSKLMSEWMLRDAGQAHGLGYVILRYFNVAGADPALRCGQRTVDATHLIKLALEAALGRRSHLAIYGDDYPTPDGTCVRDFIHVSDLAAAHAAALRHLRAGGESLTANAGYGRGYSVKEVVDTVRAVTGADFDVRLAPRRAGDAASIIADTTVLRTRLGWTPEHDDLHRIVADALAWERKLLVRQGR